MEMLTALLRDLAGFVISPMVWGLLGLGLALLLLWRGRVVAARRVLVVLLAGGLIVTSLPLGWPVIAAREADHAVAPDLGPAFDAVDGIILLGGAERPAISAHWQRPEVNEAADRVIAAAMLAHRFPDIPVIVTGGHGETRADGTVVPSEAEISARILIGLGIEPARLILEDRARNTSENARLTRDRLGARDAHDARWLLVTSGFHMTRALAEFERAGWSGLVPYPVDFRTTTWRDALGWRPYGNMAMLEAALREALGRLALRLGLL